MEINRVSAILLAAGKSARMGENKLLKDLCGKPVLAYALKLLSGMDFFERIIVTTAETMRGVNIPDNFKIIINPRPQKGQSESVKLAAEAASGEAYMFFTGDMPLLSGNDVHKLIDKAALGKITIPRVDGALKNPRIFPGFLKDELKSLKGEEGGRQISTRHGGIIEIVDFSGSSSFFDMDTPEDYAYIKEMLEKQRQK